MKDLEISYDNENGNRVNRSYDTIMSFLDDMDSDRVDIPMMDYENVEAIFFENSLTKKNFKTIEDLYNHCNMILK